MNGRIDADRQRDRRTDGCCNIRTAHHPFQSPNTLTPKPLLLYTDAILLRSLEEYCNNVMYAIDTRDSYITTRHCRRYIT